MVEAKLIDKDGEIYGSVQLALDDLSGVSIIRISRFHGDKLFLRIGETDEFKEKAGEVVTVYDMDVNVDMA